jgi:hypothetical protein
MYNIDKISIVTSEENQVSETEEIVSNYEDKYKMCANNNSRKSSYEN